MQNCKCDVCSGIKNVFEQMERIYEHKETYSDVMYLKITEALSKYYRELNEAGCNNAEEDSETDIADLFSRIREGDLTAYEEE